MKERIWFITGVSRGLGKSLAEAVLAAGDVVIGTTRDGKSSLPKSDRLQVLALDVTDRAAASRVTKEAWNLHERLDVVVNNAGGGLVGSAEEATTAEIDHVMALNFFGPVAVIQAVLPLLRRQRSGHLVNVTSIAGVAPNASSPYYAAAKFALEGLTDALAAQLNPLGIKVTAIAPGAFRTDFLTAQSLNRSQTAIEDYRNTAYAAAAHLDDIAGKQLGDPERAARVIVELAGAEHAPVHLLLGSDALARAKAIRDERAKETAAWEHVTRSTDFPA